MQDGVLLGRKISGGATPTSNPPEIVGLSEAGSVGLGAKFVVWGGNNANAGYATSPGASLLNSVSRPLWHVSRVSFIFGYCFFSFLHKFIFKF